MKVIRKFLKAKDIKILRDLSKMTCYPLLNMNNKLGLYSCGTTYNLPTNLYDKFIGVSGCPKPLVGRYFAQFISYEVNGFNAKHKDWVDPNANLYRVIVMLDLPVKGGELFADGEEVMLGVGDALVFRSEQIEHEVKPVVEGSRLIFTIGFHSKEKM